MGQLYERVVRPLLFQMDPERAHALATGSARLLEQFPGGDSLLSSLFRYQTYRLAQEVDGILFSSPVGMAAGFDKEGDLYPSLACMGFGFVESGTFTARAQPGNPRPRLFRFPRQEALLNRMGFNNPGSEAVARELLFQKRTIPRGINIGKSKVAPLERAREDYLETLSRLAPFGDYVAINVSSPNTPGLRSLQERGPLSLLLREIRNWLREEYLHRGKARELRRSRPLYVKIAPDMEEEALRDVLEVVGEEELDGVILTNTTIRKESVPEAEGMEGGVSGAPVRDPSTEMIRKARAILGKSKTIIGVGGIFSGAHALEKILAGASLVQIYTGYIYRGPMLPREINLYLDRYCESKGVTLQEIVGEEKSI